MERETRGRPKKEVLSRASEMLVVFNDLQLSEQCDPEALGAALKFIARNKEQITHFVFNGDISDYSQQSRFAKVPDELDKARGEIEDTKWMIETITNLLPNAKKVFIDGNHEARWENMIRDQTMGLEEWVKTPEEMFRFKELGWEHIEYGRGKFWKWHDRIFWHGSRSGAKSNIPKLELEDTGGVSVTTAHINRNMYHETVDVLGEYKSGIAHGGFSKDDLRFVKKANSGWTQGFGVYFHDKKTGEQPYSIIMKHGNPYFVWIDGTIYSGKGFQIGDKVK